MPLLYHGWPSHCCKVAGQENLGRDSIHHVRLRGHPTWGVFAIGGIGPEADVSNLVPPLVPFSEQDATT